MIQSPRRSNLRSAPPPRLRRSPSSLRLRGGITLLALFACIVAATQGCARFRIEELEAEAVFSLPILEEEAENPDARMQALQSGRVVHNIPLRPAFGGGRVWIADAGRRLIRVFNRGQETPEIILAAARPPALDAEVDFAPLRLGLPGFIASDEDGANVYIQNYEPAQDAAAADRDPRQPSPTGAGQDVTERPSGQVSAIRTAPARILHLNEDFETLGSLGVDGYGSTPFARIERIDADEDGLVHALYRDSEGVLHLAGYRDGRSVYRYAEFSAGTEAERERYAVEFEDFAPGPGGRFVIASASLRNKQNYDLVERIIYRLEGPESAPQEILRTDDPADYFAWTRADGGFFLMNTEEDGSRILFKIFSPAGEYLNNQLVVFPGLRISWRETFLSLDGRIFSTRLYLGRFELYEWK